MTRTTNANSRKARARGAGVLFLLVVLVLIGLNLPTCGTADRTEVVVQAPRAAATRAAVEPGAEALKKNLQRTLRRIVALQIRELISSVMS